MTMYEHVVDFGALKALIDEAMLDEEGNPKPLDDDTRAALTALAEDWKEGFKEKFERTCKFLADSEAHVDACKAESARLIGRAKVYETRIHGLKFLMQRTMDMLKLGKVETETFVVSIAKNPPSLYVEDESKIPAEFWTPIPASLSLDKAKLKEALKGGEIAGARLFQGSSLRVK